MAENKFKNVISDIRKGIKEILSDMEVVDKKILSVANNALKIGSSFKANTPDGLTQILTKQTDLLEKMNTLLQKQNTNTEKLAKSRRTLKTLTAEEVVNQRKLAKNERLQAQAVSKLVGAYDNLVAKYRQAKQNLNNLNASQTASNKQIAKATREFKKYQAQLNKANKATSNFSKNSLGGMVRGFKNLLGAFGIVGGITMIAQLTKEIFSLIKQLETLRFALDAVSESQSELIAVQEFLLDISTRYGVSLIVTTERFTKFLAAAKQSNLGLKDTERIFESVTKASAVLGLRTDELTGVYLALEQMLSKGKVTTEELRRQLGERLPGAFGIMADALGVSVSKLDKMLKKGEILSSEALPKFAVALEKAYGIESVKTVDTLAAAQGRLETSWISFVDSVNGNENKLSKVFKGLLNLANDTLKGWEKILKTQAGLNADEIEQAQSKAFNDALIRAASIVKQHGKDQEKLAKDLLTNLIEARSNEIKKIQDKISVFFGADDKGLQRSLSEGQKKRLQELNVELAMLTGETDAYTQKLNELSDVKKEDIDDDDKKIVALKGSIAFLETYIKKLTEQQQKLATTSEAYRDYARQIEEANNELLKLKSILANPKVDTIKLKDVIDIDEFDSFDFSKLFGGLDPEKDSELLSSILSKNSKDSLEATKKSVSEMNKALKGNLEDGSKAEALELQRREERYKQFTQIIGDSFSEVFDIDLSKLDFLIEHEKNTIMDWANLSKEAISGVLDASLNRYDEELQTAQASRDLIVNNTLATEKEKRLANERFEEEERRIKTKRAKQERTNTLIKIAVDTASAIASTLAPPPLGLGPLLGPAKIPIIAGIGAAQAALVASQPLPKFKEGTKSPLTSDTLAYVGDGGRSEAVTKDGKLLGVTPDKTTLAMLPKGAEVHKDAGEWLNKAIYNMNMSANGELLNSIETDSILKEEMRKMRLDAKNTWKEVKQLAKRPVQVHNNITVEQPYDKYN